MNSYGVGKGEMVRSADGFLNLKWVKSLKEWSPPRVRGVGVKLVRGTQYHEAERTKLRSTWDDQYQSDWVRIKTLRRFEWDLYYRRYSDRLLKKIMWEFGDFFVDSLAVRMIQCFFIARHYYEPSFYTGTPCV